MKLIEPDAKGSNSGASGNHSIGAILIDTGRLSTENAEKIIRHQRQEGKRFGEAAIALGLLSEDDIRFALSRQFDYPYLPVGDNSLSSELTAAYKPSSAVVEQLRALRSQLMLRWFDAEAHRKTIAIVSSGEQEGRSFLAANLAIVFSQLGERTLLVDADLRAPRQHELFKLQNDHGLSAVLAGRASAGNAVVRIPSLLGLSVMPAGAVPPNPQELLGRAAFVDTLRELEKDYDAIIIDTSAGHYADAQTVAARAGAALLLARQHLSSIGGVSRLAEDLRLAGTTIVGSVLNSA